MAIAAITATVASLLSMVRDGKKTVDEVLNDPEAKAAMVQAEETMRQQMQNEAGDKFTRRARPMLIYVCVAAFANDLLIAPYVDLFASESVRVLDGEKFNQLIGLLTALGLARSVLDKQGSWIKELFTSRSKRGSSE